MQRVCFTLRVRKDRVQDYLDAHQAWREMEQSMRDAGISNYSMFVREDGLLVGYLEAEDSQESLRRHGESDVSRRTLATLWAGVLVLVSSTVVMGAANYMKST